MAIASISKDSRSLHYIGMQQAAPLCSIQKEPGLIFFSENGCPERENLILMNVPFILYGLLSRRTNARHTHICIYINNILYIVRTGTVHVSVHLHHPQGVFTVMRFAKVTKINYNYSSIKLVD